MVPMLAPVPATAEPVFVPQDTYNLEAGRHYRFGPDSVTRYFEDAGTNPRFTDAVFSTKEYYDEAYLSQRGGDYAGIYISIKSNADLNALPSPPASPFTVYVEVTMENDEGETASGRLTISTTYHRLDTAPTPTTTPTPKSSVYQMNAPVETLVSTTVDSVFEHAGTNPRFTDVVFDTLDYYDQSYTGLLSLAKDRLFVRAKSSEQLLALPSPPTNPFTVTATAAMTNDEGQTSSPATIRFKTRWNKPAAPHVTPIPSQVNTVSAPSGDRAIVTADSLFDNAGTNPIFTDVSFATMEYYDSASIVQSGSHAGYLYVQVKTDAELLALASPPASPFTVDATVTMVNDEGWTGTRTLPFETTYERPATLESGTGAEPVLRSDDLRFDAAPGANLFIRAKEVFLYAGTNPRLTEVEFSDTRYYFSNSGIVGGGSLFVRARTAAQLSALSLPPPNPFSVTARVTMTNDEGQTATGVITLDTQYKSTAESPLPLPTLAWTSPISAPPGVRRGFDADPLFDNQGSNPRFTSVEFSTTEYYHSSSGIHDGSLYVQAKTAAELRALPVPPPSPFTVTAEVTMTNYEGWTATGTLTFTTEFEE